MVLLRRPSPQEKGACHVARLQGREGLSKDDRSGAGRHFETGAHPAPTFDGPTKRTISGAVLRECAGDGSSSASGPLTDHSRHGARSEWLVGADNLDTLLTLLCARSSTSGLIYTTGGWIDGLRASWNSTAGALGVLLI